MMPPSSFTVPEAKYWVFSVPPETLAPDSDDSGLSPANSRSRSKKGQAPFGKAHRPLMSLRVAVSRVALGAKAPNASVVSRKTREPTVFEISENPKRWVKPTCDTPACPRLEIGRASCRERVSIDV